MDTDTLIRIIVLICLLVLSAFFSSAETALTAVSPIRIRNLLDQNPSDKRAAAVMRITPKTIATIRTEKMALAYARPLIVLMTILTPIVFLINAISNGLLKLLGVSRDDAGKLTQGDIQTIVDVGHEEGIIQSDEKDIITNVFELKDSAVKEVMVPRVHVSILDADISFEELLKVFREDKYTRYPVYEDTPDRIIGTINMKDLLLYHDGDTSSFSVRNILREAHFVFEHKKIRELLAEMMEASVSIAIVVDEYGDWTGIITLEDVLEEIVGEIHDEYDEPSDDLIYQVAPNEYIAEGAISLDDFSDRLDTEIESEDYDSLGGYILEQLDRIPDVGDAVTTENGIRLVVDSVDNNRIELVHVWLPEQVTDETDHSS